MATADPGEYSNVAACHTNSSHQLQHDLRYPAYAPATEVRASNWYGHPKARSALMLHHLFGHREEVHGCQ